MASVGRTCVSKTTFLKYDRWNWHAYTNTLMLKWSNINPTSLEEYLLISRDGTME